MLSFITVLLCYHMAAIIIMLECSVPSLIQHYEPWYVSTHQLRFDQITARAEASAASVWVAERRRRRPGCAGRAAGVKRRPSAATCPDMQ